MKSKPFEQRKLGPMFLYSGLPPHQTLSVKYVKLFPELINRRLAFYTWVYLTDGVITIAYLVL